MNQSLLTPGCEKAPANPNLGYVPSNSAAVKITAADDWWKLAARPEVKAAGLGALDLCAFNFQTRNPAEINWYLRNKVGCTKATSDRKNYMFSNDASPGVIYLPKGKTSGGVIDLGETIVNGRVPVGTDGAVTKEFTFEKETPNGFSAGYVRCKVKVTGKGSITWGNASPDYKGKIATNLLKKQIGLAGEKQLTDDFTLQFGTKLIDATKPAEWRKTIRDGVEGTVKKKLKTAVIDAVEVGLKVPTDGLFFVVKVTFKELTIPIIDLGWVLDLPPEQVTATFKGSIQLTFTFGPSAAALTALKPILANALRTVIPGSSLLAGLAAWIAFCGHAISRTYQRSDDMAFYAWYVTGYVDEVLPGGAFSPWPPKPESRIRAQEMVRLGHTDARANAAKEFGGLGMDPVAAYRAHLLSLFGGAEDREASSKARKFLRSLVCAKLLQEKGIETV